MLRTEKRMAFEEEGGRKDGTRVGKGLWNLVGVTQIQTGPARQHVF